MNGELQCGPNADDRYCPQFWNLTEEIKRLHGLIRDLLESTGLDEEECDRWLDHAGISAEDDEDEAV